jgi:hypothetical protein
MASSPPLPDAAAKLLDFSQPFDVPLLDATVNAFYGAGSNDEVGGEIEKEEGEGNKSGRERECTVGIDESTSREVLLEKHSNRIRVSHELSLLRVAVCRSPPAAERPRSNSA